MLPTFEVTAAPAITAAKEAEAVGLDGVFAYDHLWPMGRPGRPSLSMFPLLGSIAASTRSIALGTLVARVGLEPDDVVVDAFSTLSAIAPGRVIAGIGTGDKKSEAEGLAFGAPATGADDRRRSLAYVGEKLQARGLEVWIGGGGDATNAVARALGCALNLWAASPDRVAMMATDTDLTWGGQLPRRPAAAVSKLVALAAAGVRWAVVSWQGDLVALGEIGEAAAARLRR